MLTRSRLAPTPSSLLHYGNLFNFVLTTIETRRRGGTLLLRIDDLDAIRAREAYVDDIFSTLRALGFAWDAGPANIDDFRSTHSQALKSASYHAFLDRFPGYAYSCSRQQIKARTDALYDGHCRDRGLSRVKGQTQWRVRSDSPKNDLVLWRKEDLPAYHLVSLQEDLSARINLIVRGEDLRESTEQQKRLANMLGDAGRPFLDRKSTRLNSSHT